MSPENTSNVEIERFFTKDIPGEVFDSIDWEKSDIGISDDTGKILFTQKDAEFPSFWSPLARKITCSKYFFGEQNSEEREGGLKELVWRVTSTMKDWAAKYNYFKSSDDLENFERELSFINVNQLMAFNSPVWFNVGTHKVEKIDNFKSGGQKDAYVFENGKRKKISVNKKATFKDVKVSAAFHGWLSLNKQKKIPKILKLMQFPCSDALSYSHLAEGRVDIVIQCSNKIWDIHPIIPIVKAAGGYLSTWDNKDAVNAGNILVSSNKTIHNKFLKLLKPVSK